MSPSAGLANDVRLAAAIVVAILTAACEPSPSVAPSSIALASPSVSPSATATLEPSASAPETTPTPTLTPTLGPWSPTWSVQPVAPLFDVTWRLKAGADEPTVGARLLDIYGEPSWAEVNGTYVFVYQPQIGKGPQIWHSADLVHWQSAIPSAEWKYRDHARYVVRGKPGFVVLGTHRGGSADDTRPALWLSSDGRAWTRVADEAVPPVQWIYGSPSGLVAFGMDTWTSTDGIAWRRVGPSPLISTLPTHMVTVLDVGTSALVFVGNSRERPPVQVHRLDPTGQWQHLSDLPGSIHWVTGAVLGPRGLVVQGNAKETFAATWRSADAVEWHRVTRPPPNGHLAATTSGYMVASAHVYYEGCAGGIGGAQTPETWTSSDGRRWHRVADPGTQDHQQIAALIGGGDALVAVGYGWPNAGWEGGTPKLWRAQIKTTGAAPLATQVAEGTGCGS